MTYEQVEVVADAATGEVLGVLALRENGYVYHYAPGAEDVGPGAAIGSEREDEVFVRTVERRLGRLPTRLALPR